MHLRADTKNKYYSPVAVEVFNTNKETLGYLQATSGVLCKIAENLEVLEATVESVTPLSQRRRTAKYALLDVTMRIKNVGSSGQLAQKADLLRLSSDAAQKRKADKYDEEKKGMKETLSTIGTEHLLFPYILPVMYIRITRIRKMRNGDPVIFNLKSSTNSIDFLNCGGEAFGSVWASVADLFVIDKGGKRGKNGVCWPKDYRDPTRVTLFDVLERFQNQLVATIRGLPDDDLPKHPMEDYKDAQVVISWK